MAEQANRVIMTDEQIIAIASKRNASLEIGLPVLQLGDLSQAIQTSFPEGNFTFCIRDVDESFVNDYLEALFASAKRMIQDSGMHAIYEAKVYWVNQYDSDANPDCLNGHFKMFILAPKPSNENLPSSRNSSSRSRNCLPKAVDGKL